jgi:hypothetical protein
MRRQVLQWVHASLSAGHPGISRTLHLLKKFILVAIYDQGHDRFR